MKLFELRRDVDETGVSGTGTVAQGVIFDNGQCALTWLTKHTSCAVYPGIEAVVAIHGHDGKTRVVQVCDYDEKKIQQLCRNCTQDHFENVSVDFRSKNHRAIWNERDQLVALFEEAELRDGEVG